MVQKHLSTKVSNTDSIVDKVLSTKTGFKYVQVIASTNRLNTVVGTVERAKENIYCALGAAKVPTEEWYIDPKTGEDYFAGVREPYIISLMNSGMTFSEAIESVVIETVHQAIAAFESSPLAPVAIPQERGNDPLPF